MKLGKRVYWAIGLVAVLALAGAAVTFTARLTSAGGSTPSADACDQAAQATEAPGTETTKGPDTDSIECGPQDEADASDAADGSDAADTNKADDGEAQVPSGTLDDGKDLLPQAGITIDAAIAAAQSAGSGSIGEVDLEQSDGRLVFNVDVGDKDVKVDASNGTVLSADKND
jgi:uncharacterized membrane protein YkoI